MEFRSTSVSEAVAALDERSKEIFRRIVEGYLETGEPLGSRNLSRILPMSLSPASVRNVMSDLEELGLIYSPHVSSGRLPTQIGLRFFVDAFMQVGDLSAEDRANIDRQVRAFNPWPIAETSFGNETLRVLRARVAEPGGTHGEPGTLLGLAEDGLRVACGAGVLAIGELQRAGKRPISARDFANAVRVAGLRFGK